MPHVARRLAFPGLVLCVICLCGCTSLVNTLAGVDSLDAPLLDEGWEIGYGGKTPDQMLVEYVRPGQTVENWTEMVSVQAFNKGFNPVSIEDELVRVRNSLDELCPGSTLALIRQMPDGVIYESRSVNCQGSGEHALVRILDGIYSRFVVHYAVRGAMTMTPARRAEWIEGLTTFRILSP